MRIAGAIFLVSGLAYLVWGVSSVISNFFNGLAVSWLGSLLMAAFAAALLYFVYGLLRATAGARWGAIFVSACLVSACSYTLSLFGLPPSIASLRTITTETWATIGVLLTVCVAHLTAIVLLLFAKPSRPNLSLNPDAPSAGAHSNILARPPSRRAG